MERIPEQLVSVPVEYPGIQKGIHMRYEGIGHVSGQRPQHDDGEDDKKAQDRQVDLGPFRYRHRSVTILNRQLRSKRSLSPSEYYPYTASNDNKNMHEKYFSPVQDYPPKLLYNLKKNEP
jgi:hypothetical protein